MRHRLMRHRLMRLRLMRLRLSSLCCLCLLLPSAVPAQDEPELPFDPEQFQQMLNKQSEERIEEEVIPPQEPMNPREELFLAIELRDVEAARKVLEEGSEFEINDGVPSPLATAALHNDLRMVALLLDFGADPSAIGDSPLEEAIRHENARMVELLMRAGAQVPVGDAGQQLFRLAQRGGGARELSEILLDHQADPDLCLAAATAESRIDLMMYCLGREADLRSLPAQMNALSVALASGEAEIVDLVLEQGPTDATMAGALGDAVAAGRMDLVRRAVAAGAEPTFGHLEAAVDHGQTEICLFLLEQSPPDDAAVLSGGDAQGLIQRAGDLGLEEMAAALRRKSGLSVWKNPWLPGLAGALFFAFLGGLVLNLLRRRSRTTTPTPAESAPWVRPRPAPPAAAAAAPPAAAAAPAAAVRVSSPPVPGPPGAAAPGPGMSPAATIPVGSVQAFPATSEAPAVPRPSPPAMPAPENAGGSRFAAVPDPPLAGGEGWQLVPEPVAEVRAAGLPPEPVVASAAGGEPAVELRMPPVDLSRDVASVFAAARHASSGETVRPDAPDRRQVVLVTPSRVTMLHSCPAPGSLSPLELAAAEGIAPVATPRNVAVITYTELDPMSSEISTAIPFFDLLKKLGYLGHAVWIFEGHVSAMAAGCQDADVLIVDDGMIPYLPGNWRSVATRAMRGSDVHLFERKSGSLRRLR